jgi:Xaa-Pro dipeptidase
MSTRTEDEKEFRRRLEVVRGLMRAEGIDALVVADDDSFFSGGVRYLSNFSAGHHTQAFLAVVLPLEGEPTLVVHPGPREGIRAWARQSSWIDDVRCSPVVGWPPHFDLLNDVVAAVDDAGAASGRIGISGRCPDLKSLAARLPKAQVAPAVAHNAVGLERDLLDLARAVKSEWEVERLRTAQRYADLGIRAFMAAVRPGERQALAMAAAEWAAKSAGAEDVEIPMESGTDPWVWWVYQGERTFTAGDMVSLELNARDRGYVAQIGRSGVIGTPSRAQELLIETGTAALAAMAAELKPGVTGRELWEVGLAVVEEAGLAPWGRFGHGMGLSMSETFDVYTHDEFPVEDGWCVALHAGVIHGESEQSVMIGEQYMIENGHAAALSESIVPYDLAPSADLASVR